VVATDDDGILFLMANNSNKKERKRESERNERNCVS
jgi:hypothetical protein